MEHLIDRISKAKKIVLVSHIHPDGDAVASILGLYSALSSLSKTVVAVLKDGVPPIFQFLVPSEVVITDLPDLKEYDLCIILDAPDSSRTGFAQEIKQAAAENKIVFIDHHPKGDLARLTSTSLHDTSSSSAAELVFQLCVQLGIKVSPTLATTLLAGVYTDTGGFQLPNTSTRTLENAAELMRRGARLQKITTQITHTKTIAGLRLLGIALEHVYLSQDQSCAVSVLNEDDLIKTKANPEDVSGIIKEINVLPHIPLSLLLIQINPTTIRGIIRANDETSLTVNQLAKLLGGGGHPKAAGFLVRGHLEQTAIGWTIKKLPHGLIKA